MDLGLRLGLEHFDGNALLNQDPVAPRDIGRQMQRSAGSVGQTIAPKSELSWDSLLRSRLRNEPRLSPADARALMQRALVLLERNIGPADTAPGFVIASPKRSGPDYFFDWTRDSALVMQAYQQVGYDAVGASRAAEVADHYADRVRERHANSSPGEVKYNPDNSPYTGPWGRPQNDGPALRAQALLLRAEHALAQGDEATAAALYGGGVPAQGPIKVDLEYIAHHWREHCYDYWEEVEGLHFSTAMVQRRALLEGARLADRLGDPDAAKFYRTQADALDGLLESFWNEARGHVDITTESSGGVPIGEADHEGGFFKGSRLDIASILAVIHGGIAGKSFGVDDPRAQRTLLALVRHFEDAFPVNEASLDFPGTAIGRYPGDIWNGYQRAEPGAGHAWFLATHAVAEFLYRLAGTLGNEAIAIDAENLGFWSWVMSEGSLGEQIDAEDAKQALLAQGDGFIARSVLHASEEGAMSEQMDKRSGFLTGPNDLSWSYSSLLTALHARFDALGEG